MQIHVDSVTDVKTGQYGVSSKIVSGSDHYFVNEDATKYVGKTLEVEVSEKTSKSGNKYKIAKILREITGSSGGGNGHIAWSQYEHMAKLAHGLAVSLEPDEIETGDENSIPLMKVDRSASRAAILNTVMIAFSNGKISLPEDADEMPF